MGRKSTNPHQTIINNLSALSRAELVELQAMIADKLADMKASSGLLVDMFGDDDASDQPTKDKSDVGYYEDKFITSSTGKVNGPYRYFRYRDDAGHLRSKYVGRGEPQTTVAQAGKETE